MTKKKLLNMVIAILSLLMIIGFIATAFAAANT